MMLRKDTIYVISVAISLVVVGLYSFMPNWVSLLLTADNNQESLSQSGLGGHEFKIRTTAFEGLLGIVVHGARNLFPLFFILFALFCEAIISLARSIITPIWIRGPPRVLLS